MYLGGHSVYTVDPDMTVRTITTGDIANGALSDLDAIIIQEEKEQRST